jgi:hypothetical protein
MIIFVEACEKNLERFETTFFGYMQVVVYPLEHGGIVTLESVKVVYQTNVYRGKLFVNNVFREEFGQDPSYNGLLRASRRAQASIPWPPERLAPPILSSLVDSEKIVEPSEMRKRLSLEI